MTLPNKTVIITGGNSGLGYQNAKVLAQSGGWHIIIASRSPQRTQDAVTTLINETGYPHIQPMTLDLASQTSIRQFASAFKRENVPPLHAIVCNAGMTSTSFSLNKTADGIETIFGVNHLGHFLLVNLLLDVLIAPARIIFVSSGTHIPEHRLARMTGVPKPRYMTARYLALPEQAPADQRVTHPTQRYSTSKLCNVLCAYELSRQLVSAGLSTPESPIDVFALDPGLMPGTGFLRELPAILRGIFSGTFNLLQPLIPGVRLPEQSGRDLARLVTDPALIGKTSLYFDGQKETQSSKDSYDLAKARDLWETSIELTHLQADESPLLHASLATV